MLTRVDCMGFQDFVNVHPWITMVVSILPRPSADIVVHWKGLTENGWRKILGSGQKSTALMKDLVWKISKRFDLVLDALAGMASYSAKNSYCRTRKKTRGMREGQSLHVNVDGRACGILSLSSRKWQD